jgi:hypothetical protein
MKDYISQIQKIMGIPVLDLHLSEQFCSEMIGYRKQIRDHIVDTYKSQLADNEISEIKNLNLIPKSEKIFFSISHHYKTGGYTACSVAHGFDIELKSRISNQIIHRVSTPDEISESPNIQFLWCAKEAAFKAMSSAHLTISDVCCTGWTSQIKTDLWMFALKSSEDFDLNRNKGFVFQDQNQIISIFFK